MRPFLASNIIALAVVAAPLFAAEPAPPARGASEAAPQHIDIVAAQKAMSAAQAAASAASVKVAIAIVDANGDLVDFVRLDGAPSRAVTTSEGKARAAVLFGVPTKQVQDAIASGKALQVQLTAPRSGPTELTPFQGGIPILKDGKVIAGIGVGGSAPPMDEQIAQAGAAAALH